MKRKVSKIRPSPNEEARLIREEHERRRKLRIQQVREQQRYIALQIRQEVERRRQRELEQLGEELKQDWEQQQREKLETLQRLYQESLQLLGQGHRSAKENEPDLAAIAQKEKENNTKAEERYREALKELKSQRLKDHEVQTQAINARKKALQAERERSAKVASLPPPPPNPIQQYIDLKKRHLVRKSDVSAFAFTHYNMSESTVDREVDTQQPNAHEEAVLELKRVQHMEKDEKRRREEQLEKARLRGKQALKREQLMQDRERLLVELEHMQQKDLLRRRQQVSQMPPQIFQPLYKRHEMSEDLQREMEFAFEDMYTGERRVKGDLVVQLIPEPLPAPSTSSQDQELDVTMDEVCTVEIENTQPDTEQEAESTDREISYYVESAKTKPAPRRALKKLLDRIRSQRNQWTDHSSHDAAADLPTALPDQVPERDTTIDTGSLTSEDKDKLPPFELMQPFHSQAALDTTEESTAAETVLPDIPPNRFNNFEEERKKREEELESEKQKQLVLLQELEEQKNKLEELLLEAQQEREDLKAAVNRESPVTKAEVPQDRATSVISGLSTKLVPPAGEDDHKRRIRQYQQQLLEQKRVHKRSVEVARQRLEEYQRALRIRYMSSTSVLPAATPPSFTQPSLQSVLHLPAPLKLPTSASNPTKYHTSIVPARNMKVSPVPSSFIVGSKLQPDEMKSRSDSARNHRPDFASWLTDGIMERVTEHLPERVRPSSSNMESMPDKLYTINPSANIPLQPLSGRVQSIGPSLTDGAHLDEGHAGTKSVSFLRSKKNEFERQKLEIGSLSSREDDLERQRQELKIRSLSSREEELEKQRQKLEVESLSLRDNKLERQRQELKIGSLRFREDDLERQEKKLEMESLSSREDDLERQKRDLQEVHRRVLNYSEAVALQERRQEERRHVQDMQMEHIRQQKEALQALLHGDSQPVLETEGEVQVSENTKQTRLRLLASLLRAIEESNGGTLSHLEETQEKDSIVQETTRARPDPGSATPLGIVYCHQAAKPPVSRARLGPVKVMTDQHELSVIREVETPVDSSLVTEDSVAVASYIVDSGGVWDLQEESELSVVSKKVLQQTGQRPAGSVESLASSNSLTRRKRLLTGAEAFPNPSTSGSILRITSPLSSDSGRGDDFSGPPGTNYRSHTESPHRSSDSDCLLSTTISTGSYITTDPEQNTDKSPPVRGSQEIRPVVDLLNMSSPLGQSSCIKESSGGLPDLAVHSLFNDSSIQRIIDRYMKELDISLSTVGRTAGVHESSNLETLQSSVSQQSLVEVSEERAATEESSTVPQSNTARRQGSRQELHITAGEDISVAQDPEQDSFRPLIGQLADESSCISDRRESAMVRLVGHPTAHSSMVGQLPGLLPVNLDQGEWDSTLSRMIGRLSHQSSSPWLSGGQDFYAGQLMGQMRFEQSTTWLGDNQEESQMRPLVGELDDDQHSGNSSERTCVDLSISTEVSLLSHKVSPPEALSCCSSIPGVNPQRDVQTPQNQTSQMDLGKTEVFPGSDSFHPLLAEVTHNDTAEPCMTFHLPGHEVPSSSAEQQASGQSDVSTPVDESGTHSDGTMESELSPENLRTQEQSICPTALHESFSQLIISQSLPHESVLSASPTKRTDVDLAPLTLSNLSMCDVSDVSMPQLEEEANRSCNSKKHSVPSRDFCPEELKSGDGGNLGSNVFLWKKALEMANEKGILEQSAITLVSLTDTTQETTITEDEFRENKHLVEEREEGQKGQQMEGSELALLPEEMPSKLHSVKFLEFHWGPNRDLQEDVYQQKRADLLQKSSQRVREIKAKEAPAKVRPGNQDLSTARQSKPEGSQPYICKAKTKSGPRLQDPKTNVGPAKHQTTQTRSMKQKKTQPSPGSESRHKKLEVKICTLEQRKQDVTEMHQRTQRLYEQLEEVKHQKAIKGRQETYAKNRLRAKEFHKKTLQKLRAKQT